MSLVCNLFVMLMAFCVFTGSALSDSLLVTRSTRRLVVLDSSGKALEETPIGIGRGGLKSKASMADFVTPTGDFQVDIILSRDPVLCAIADSSKERFTSDPRFAPLVRDGGGLARLFGNMLSLDFDGDGAPDNAYGAAYIGLDSPAGITGPKMRMYKDTPYWYSIALHGTAHPDTDIGAMNSGGCVHLPEKVLLELIRSGRIRIGTRVRIVD